MVEVCPVLPHYDIYDMRRDANMNHADCSFVWLPGQVLANFGQVAWLMAGQRAHIDLIVIT